MEEKECEFKVKGSQYINGEYLCFASTNSKKICPNKLCKDNPNCYYKQLQLKDKMIELILGNIVNSQSMTNTITYASLFYKFEQQALAELEE